MAEIHVQTKRRGSPVWVWILVALLILGTIAYILVWRNNNKAGQKNTSNSPSQTSFIQFNASENMVA
jgi:paraquat-inducible protein B